MHPVETRSAPMRKAATENVRETWGNVVFPGFCAGGEHQQRFLKLPSCTRAASANQSSKRTCGGAARGPSRNACLINMNGPLLPQTSSASASVLLHRTGHSCAVQHFVNLGDGRDKPAFRRATSIVCGHRDNDVPSGQPAEKFSGTCVRAIQRA